VIAYYPRVININELVSMTIDIPEVPKNNYEEMKCEQCQKVIGWGRCICDQWAKGLLETICPECYLQNVVNKQDNIDKKNERY
jgi:hypothetical protein